MTIERTLPLEQTLALNPLDALMDRFSHQTDAHSHRLGLDPRVRNVLVTAGAAAAIGAFTLGPSIADAMINKGLGLGESIVYAVGSTLGTAGTFEHIDTETAIRTIEAFVRQNPGDLLDSWRNEIPKLATEWRLLMNEVLIAGLALGGIEKLFHMGRIREGKADIKRKEEQMVILGGSSSNIADALVFDNPQQNIPIFDSPKGAEILLAQLAPERGGLNRIIDPVFTKPVFLSLNVGRNENHRGREEWKRLHLNRSNLIRTNDNRHILLVVGCGETPEEELRETAETADVTVEEVNTDTEMMIDSLARNGVARNDYAPVKVYLGSADSSRIDDESETGAMKFTDREVALKSGIDIYIDTWRANLWGLKKKLIELGTLNSGIRLVSDNPKFRQLFKQIATEIDIPYLTKEEDTHDQATLCVYEDISDNTLNKASRLQGLNPGRTVIALTSNIETAKRAKELKLNYVCSAEIVRNLVKSVRFLLKLGKSPAEIQQFIDDRLNNHVGDVSIVEAYTQMLLTQRYPVMSTN